MEFLEALALTLFKALPRRGGAGVLGVYSRIQVRGKIELGQKTTPKKDPRGFQQNPEKPLDQKSIPQQIQQLQNKFGCILFAELSSKGTLHYHESSDCFEYPKKSLFKSSHPKKVLAKFSYPRRLRVTLGENLKAEKT